ncbi:MAG: diaminopimelate decarboxylase [Endomicrobium sp.]|jgi:diaminopimelate decarboxylase|nr:diaminopimelate decarboxylase [Endomicrobium sp.]
MFKFNNNDLFIEQVRLLDLVNKYKTSTYVYSKNKIIKNFEEYNKCLTEKNDSMICFACKANSNKTILTLLASLGAGADTTSGGEIYRCLQAGFNPLKIVYAGVGKTNEEIEYALKNNILMFNVESEEELNAIDQIANKCRTKARIAFRINPDVNPDTHSYIVTGSKETKFGIPYENAIKTYLNASKKKNIILYGIHFHIGSQILDIEPFKLAGKKIKLIIDNLKKHNIHIQYINCGGGLGIQYSKNDKNIISKYQLMSVMFEIFGENNKFIFEPGRSILADAGGLLIKVIYRKISGNKHFLITDAGMNDLIRPTLYGAHHDVIPITKTCITNNVLTDIVGPICESGDFLARNLNFPIVQQGEILLIKDTGAYGASMSSEYNSRPKIAEVLIDGEKAILIRKRANYNDLLLNEL